MDQSTKTKHKHRTKKHKTKFHTTSPAHNTRSRTQATGPASRTRAHTQLTKIRNRTQTGHSGTVYASISQLENDFHQALAIMDTETGKLLSYRQLMRNSKLKTNRSTSSANDFGWLENGVGGQIENSINTIVFITRKEIPHDKRKKLT